MIKLLSELQSARKRLHSGRAVCHTILWFRILDKEFGSEGTSTLVLANNAYLHKDKCQAGLKAIVVAAVGCVRVRNKKNHSGGGAWM